MGEYQKSRWIEVLVFIFDILICIFVCYITENIVNAIYGEGCFTKANYIEFTLITIVMFFSYDMYSRREIKRFDTMVAMIISVTISAIGTLILNIISDVKVTEMLTYFCIYFLAILFLAAEKLVYSKIISTMKGRQKILIIDSAYSRSKLARKIKYSCEGFQSAWYMMINEGEETDIKKVLDEMHNCDSIFILPAVGRKATQKIIDHAIMLGKSIYQIPTLERVGIIGGKILQFDDTPAVLLNPFGFSKLQSIIKRAFDICAALAGTIISLPIMLVCAVAIKLDSPGPVFYKQERYTIHKKRFNVYKFRTMYIDAEKMGAKIAEKDDPRVTRVGKILRMCRLDEIPQILNILSGSMSIVGPRPERPVFADEFCEKVNYYKTRYCVKAGLTGYAQVYGKYNTRASDKILMDMIYITQYSFWLDLKIILLTVKVMFLKEATAGLNDEFLSDLNSDEKEYERIIAKKNWK